MKKDSSGQLRYSPSDLVRYLASPFASWMDRYHLENPDAVTPDEQTAEDRLIAQTGNRMSARCCRNFDVCGKGRRDPASNLAVARR